jgi:alpha-glucosidase (family GH31 glycosyl hydrolase)
MSDGVFDDGKHFFGLSEDIHKIDSTGQDGEQWIRRVSIPSTAYLLPLGIRIPITITVIWIEK